MVKKYAELYLEARRRLRPTEGENAGNVARELVCAASGKTPEQPAFMRTAPIPYSRIIQLSSCFPRNSAAVCISFSSMSSAHTL